MCFLHKAHHSLLVLRNTRPHFSPKLGAILNSEIPPPSPKKNKNAKICVSKYTIRMTLVYCLRP